MVATVVEVWSTVKRMLGFGFLVLVAGFAAIQFVPYGRNHTNPPVRAEPQWDSPATRQLAVVACFDCHSNQVAFPWYSNVAPVSWLVQKDVDEGRKKLNFSEWDRPQDEGEDAGESVAKGEMPPLIYTLTHLEARLSPDEKSALVRGLNATLGGEGEDGERGASSVSRERDDEDDDGDDDD